MKARPVTRVVLSLLFLASMSVFAQESAKCSASANECEREIRQMLSGRRYLGVQIADLNPGIVIRSINDDGPAVHTDLEPGDRIIAVNGKPMKDSTIRDFKAVLGEVRDKGGMLFMIIQRRTVYHRIEVRLQPYPKVQIDKIVAAHLAQSHAAATGQ